MEEVIEFVQQNWEKYESNDLAFLEKLDKQQIIMLLQHNRSSNIPFTYEQVCYKCLKMRGCNYYKNIPHCYDCAKKNNLVNFSCKRLEKGVINLKKHIIGIIGNEYKCVSHSNSITSTNIFPMQVKNLEWYLHCFGINNNFYKNEIKDTMMFFELENRLHYKFFMKQTRFNHYIRFQNSTTFRCNTSNHNFYYEPYQNESSVEMIMAIIDTARLVFRERRVPKCIRNLLIEWYLI